MAGAKGGLATNSKLDFDESVGNATNGGIRKLYDLCGTSCGIYENKRSIAKWLANWKGHRIRKSFVAVFQAQRINSEIIEPDD